MQSHTLHHVPSQTFVGPQGTMPRVCFVYDNSSEMKRPRTVSQYIPQ